MSFLAELFGAKPLRKVEGAGLDLFLTFDDGPDLTATPLILKILERHKARATFFMVAEKARCHPELVREILAAGHTIGNHSLDHGYRAFFQGRRRMLKWLDDSRSAFREIGVPDPIGFRPPAGIVTPELTWALKQRGLRLVLWENRFFDTTFKWTDADATKAARKVSSGSIVLLHDRKEVSWMENSGHALEAYIAAATARGFRFEPLTQEICNRKN